jgi:hypothetical protein
MPAMVINMEAVPVDNAILLDYLTSEEALEEPEIRSTDSNILIDNNCTDDELHFRMTRGSGDFDDDGDESDAILTASQRQLSTTELGRFDLGTSDVNRYESKDGGDADADEEEEASQAQDGSMENVEE